MTEIETPGVPEEDEQAGGITTLHHRLRNLILESVYPPGAWLSERDLAQTFGVSRTPLREVLRMLQREGLVSQVGEQLRATMASYADQSQRYRLILAYREIHAQSVSAVEHGRILQACRERNREEAVQQYARHLARTALTALAHMAPEYEPVAVRSALALVHMGSASPLEAPRSGRQTEEEKKKNLARTFSQS